MSIPDRALPKPAFELTEKKSEATTAKRAPAKAKVTKIKRVKAANATAWRKAPAKTGGTKASPASHPASHRAEVRKPGKPGDAAVAHPSIPKPSPAIAKQPANASAD
jgi:hypothetical protein